jgi:hypothetical protein
MISSCVRPDFLEVNGAITAADCQKPQDDLVLLMENKE